MGILAAEGDYEGHISGPVTVTLPPPETGRRVTVSGPGAVREWDHVQIMPSDKPVPVNVIWFEHRDGNWVEIPAPDGDG